MKLSKNFPVAKQGFTLIELLIVIGVLGILATGLMAAVDPFEQLKKARDANNRNAVVELHNAATRYYATHGSFPWDVTPAVTTCDNTIFGGSRATDPTALPLNDANMSLCIAAFEADGELKTGFLTALGNTAANMHISSTGLTQVSVCFAPEGKALWNDPQTKYNMQGVDCGTTACATGTYQADCTATAKSTGGAGMTPGATDPNSCFWCVR